MRKLTSSLGQQELPEQQVVQLAKAMCHSSATAARHYQNVGASTAVQAFDLIAGLHRREQPAARRATIVLSSESESEEKPALVQISNESSDEPDVMPAQSDPDSDWSVLESSRDQQQTMRVSPLAAPSDVEDLVSGSPDIIVDQVEKEMPGVWPLGQAGPEEPGLSMTDEVGPSSSHGVRRLFFDVKKV